MARKQQQQQRQHSQTRTTAEQQGEVHHEGHHILPLKVYFGVFAALMFLLLATVGVNWIFPEGGPLAVFIALLIAFVKMLLVLLYFMHVKYSSKLIWLASSAAFFWLAILFVLTLSDYISRPWMHIPSK